MEITPRLTATIALAALVPVGIYAALSGKLTPVTTAFGALNVIIIAGSLMLMFGPTDEDHSEENGTAS